MRCGKTVFLVLEYLKTLKGRSTSFIIVYIRDLNDVQAVIFQRIYFGLFVLFFTMTHDNLIRLYNVWFGYIDFEFRFVTMMSTTKKNLDFNDAT